MEKLVAYFSATGTTEKVAKELAQAAGADLFRIVPAEPYTTEDLDWMDNFSRSSIEMGNPDSRPEIKDKVENIRRYDVIFLGFPIWWYVAPTVINTFLEQYDLEGKRVILFATSGGSGFGKTLEKLRYSTAAELVEGKLLNPASTSTISDWVKELSF